VAFVAIENLKKNDITTSPSTLQNFLFFQKHLLESLGTEECITNYLPISFEIETPKTRGSVIGLLKAAKRLYIGGVPS
jgi:hypothetical protein